MPGIFNKIKNVFKGDKPKQYKKYQASQLKIIAMKTRLILEQSANILCQHISKQDNQFKFVGQDANKMYNILQSISKKVLQVQSIKIMVEMVKKIQAGSALVIQSQGDIFKLKYQLPWLQSILWYRKNKQIHNLQEIYDFCLNFFKGYDLTAQLNVKCQLFQIYPIFKYLQGEEPIYLPQILIYIQPYVSFSIDQPTLDSIIRENNNQILDYKRKKEIQNQQFSAPRQSYQPSLISPNTSSQAAQQSYYNSNNIKQEEKRYFQNKQKQEVQNQNKRQQQSDINKNIELPHDQKQMNNNKSSVNKKKSFFTSLLDASKQTQGHDNNRVKQQSKIFNDNNKITQIKNVKKSSSLFQQFLQLQKSLKPPQKQLDVLNQNQQQRIQEQKKQRYSNIENQDKQTDLNTKANQQKHQDLADLDQQQNNQEQQLNSQILQYINDKRDYQRSKIQQKQWQQEQYHLNNNIKQQQVVQKQNKLIQDTLNMQTKNQSSKSKNKQFWQLQIQAQIEKERISRQSLNKSNKEDTSSLNMKSNNEQNNVQIKLDNQRQEVQIRQSGRFTEQFAFNDFNYEGDNFAYEKPITVNLQNCQQYSKIQQQQASQLSQSEKESMEIINKYINQNQNNILPFKLFYFKQKCF